ncbi:MAG TPA: Fe-S cluster assembly protein SufD [Parachlamydiaceae bacterium]|nr:Fe-S cluster assembly protein SufD [Parachlamydiaceae bacterium]
MMTEQREGQETFQLFLEDLYGQIDDAADPLQKIRAKAWEHFLELGLPTKRNDVYRYVRLRSFFANSYEPAQFTEVAESTIDAHVLPECTNSVAVFINGQFSPLHSRLKGVSSRIVIETIAQGMKTYGSFLNSQSTKSLKDETDPFAALNAAVHSDGLFLYLPPKTISEVPLQLLNIIDTDTVPMFIVPRVQIFVGMQSQISIVSTQTVLSGGNYAFNMVADISIEEDAHVRYTQAACGINERIWHFEAIRATLKRDSTLNTVNVTDGSATARFDYRAALIGPNAEVLLNGVWMLAGKNEAHMHVLVDHQAPNCRSMQLFKGALGDFSRSSFEGKILVRQAAQKTEAFQLNKNLLLSDRANADSKPNLEIFADDVKASHGSTVGQLDKDQIFYMKTRGFSDAAAKNLLVYGFCQEVIDLITIPSLHDSLKKVAQGFLHSS